MKKVELLAPAGSLQSLKAAVNAGADAVYIGGLRFGARAFADNPDEDSLITGIEYCHLRGKKIYMTVNTLFKDAELSELGDFLRPYYGAGLDAVIVQDLGAMQYISKMFPDLPIHVSTQTSVTMAEGINRLCSMFPSITRVVPARELSLEELTRMRENTAVELEIFIHGALCYCYSGQCLMSSMIGGRSGNRGRCAQPCRKQYDGKYLLSPKDNCTLESIAELIEAGMDSFKIEGRMKSPEYTAGVVSIYRKYIDLYYLLGAKGYKQYLETHRKGFEADMDVLRELYNRGGFNHGYIHTYNGPEMMTFDRPNHSGIQVGEVITTRGREAVIRFDRMVNPQDILEIRDNQAKVFELTLGSGFNKGETFSCITMKGKNAVKGQKVFRTKCNELLCEISYKYVEAISRVKINGRFTARLGQAMELVLWVEDKAFSEKISANATGAMAEPAQKSPVTVETVKKQLMKLGETPFEADDIEIALDDGCFIVMGELNRLRREAVENLQRSILEARSVRETMKENTSPSKEPAGDSGKAISDNETIVGDFSFSVWSCEQYASVIKVFPNAEVIYNICSVSIEQLSELERIDGFASERLVIGLPYICRAQVFDKLKSFIETAIDMYPGIGFMARNHEEVVLLENLGCKYLTDYNMYCMNQTALSLYDNGVTLPQELNLEELTGLLAGCDSAHNTYGDEAYASSGVRDMIVYGYQPVMFSAQCVYKNKFGRCRGTQGADFITITDELDHDFRCRQVCAFCTNIIYNSAKLNTLSKLEEIKQAGICHFRVDFTFETADETMEILEKIKSGRYEDVRGDHYTNGHLLRGVL